MHPYLVPFAAVLVIIGLLEFFFGKRPYAYHFTALYLACAVILLIIREMV